MDDAGLRDEWVNRLQKAIRLTDRKPGGAAVVTTTSRNYFAGTWVLARMLQRFSPGLDLWVYYRPDDVPPDRLDSLSNVRLLDLSVPVPEYSYWPIYTIRSALLMRCGLKLAFWMGSDTYPVADVSGVLLDADANGAVFWEDQPEGDKFDPAMYGLPSSAREATFQIQGDTLAMNLEKCRRPLAVAHWLNLNGPTWFNRGAWYDQSHFRAAWALCGRPQFKYAPGRVDWQSSPGHFLHQGRDGTSPLIVHRVASKWHPGGAFSMPLTRDDRLPCEAEAWGYYEEWLKG